MNTDGHSKHAMIWGSPSWEQRVREVYFNLNVAFRCPQSGSGRLLDQALGNINISCLNSSAVRYQRPLVSNSESCFLITMPLQDGIRMQQGQKDTVCGRGHVLLQHANEPYTLEYEHENTLWVMKVPARLLNNYVNHAEMYTAMTFDGHTGIGRLFTQNVLVLGEELFNNRLNMQQEAFYNDYLLQLFAQMVTQDARIVHSDSSNVRTAQLHKIQQFMCTHLHNADLNPSYVAAACGISVRYLHNLFKNQDTTFTRFLQQQRLQAAYVSLQQHPILSVSDVAYRCGFNDQSHFTRLFKQTYQITPLSFKKQGKIVTKQS